MFPEYGRFAVAYGAALYARAGGTSTVAELTPAIEKSLAERTVANRLPPLFESEADYEAFRSATPGPMWPGGTSGTTAGDAWLGIDCGSTTTKLALLSADKELLYTYYAPTGATRCSW